MTIRRSAGVFAFFVSSSRRLLAVIDGAILWWDGWFPAKAMRVPPIGHSAQVDSGGTTLAGWYSEAVRPQMGLLICHGIGDRMEYWRAAQQYLGERGVSSAIFHYSGYPGSEGETTPANLQADVRAAYCFLRGRVNAGDAVYVLGFSMGTGIVAEVAAELSPPPAGVILCQAYTGFRAAATRVVRGFAGLGNVMPDIWRTTENVAHLRGPLLLVHGERDSLFPVAMAGELARSAERAGVDVRLEVVPGCGHNSVYRHVPEAYWRPILEFMRAHSAIELPPALGHD